MGIAFDIVISDEIQILFELGYVTWLIMNSPHCIMVDNVTEENNTLIYFLVRKYVDLSVRPL